MREREVGERGRGGWGLGGVGGLERGKTEGGL